MGNKEKKTLIAFILLVVALVLIVTAGAYAMYSFTGTGTRENRITTGTITLDYNEPAENYVVTSATPTSDSQGESSNNYFEFDLTGTSPSAVVLNYTIYLTQIETNPALETSDVKIYLTSVNGSTETAVSAPAYPKLVSELSSCTTAKCGLSAPLSTSYILKEGVMSLNGNTVTDQYRLRMWLRSDYNYGYTGGNIPAVDNGDVHTATIEAKTFKMRVNIYSYTV